MSAPSDREPGPGVEYRWQCLDCDAWDVPDDDSADGLPALRVGAQDHADDEAHGVEIVRVVEVIEPAEDDDD